MDKRFPVANTDPPLTVPWEVAEQAYLAYHSLLSQQSLERFSRNGGFTEAELDTWYGKHWQEVAQ